MVDKLEMYRQGDVLLSGVPSLPERAEDANVEDRIVLAYGEVTGHAHAISSDQARLFLDGDSRFIVVGEAGANLVHEEHSTIHLKHGVYRIVQQREYIPMSSRLVVD